MAFTPDNNSMERKTEVQRGDCTAEKKEGDGHVREKKEKKERESKHLFADYAHHHCRGQRGIACELGFSGKQGNGSGGCDRGG